MQFNVRFNGWFQSPSHHKGLRVLSSFILVGACCAQNDPGPRGGQPGAGGAYSSLNFNEQFLFGQAATVFQEVDSVSGNMPGESGVGIGSVVQRE